MSIVICERCERQIDSDKDDGCFSVNPYNRNDITAVCEPCREKAWDRQQERLMEDGPGPSLLEQQIEARKFK